MSICANIEFPINEWIQVKFEKKKKKKKKTAQGVSEKKFKSVDGRGVSTIAHPEPSAQVS